MTPPKKRISLCMIVKNEADLLSRCLSSAQACADEIIVVDTGSIDDTIAIAKTFGARVFESPWQNDFSLARNVSLKQATGDWILWLDADDIMPAESIPLIRSLANDAFACVYGFTVRNQKPGETGSSFIQARMFPNRKDLFFERRIHEQIMLSAMRAGLALVAHPEIVVEHHGYADPAVVHKKAERNVALLLEEFDPKNPDAVLALEIAESYILADNPTAGQIWYTKTLNFPNIQTTMPHIASQAYMGIGKACNDEENYLEAIVLFDKAIALLPRRVDALYCKAVSQELLGDISGARVCLGEIIAATESPTLVGIDHREAQIKAYLRLERLLRENDGEKESMALVIMALDAYPLRPEILTMAGRVLLVNNKPRDAMALFEKSLGYIQENNLDAYLGLCTIYVKAGRPEVAAKTLQSIAPLFQDNARLAAFKKAILPLEYITSNQPVDEHEIVKVSRDFGL